MGEPRGRVIFVAYYAPPAVGIAAQRLLGFVRHLPALGWDPTVVAPLDPHYHRVPGAPSFPPEVPVVRARNPEPSRWLRRLAGAGPAEGADGHGALAPAPAGRVGGAFRRLARTWLYVPDAQLLWIPAAARAAERAARGSDARPVVLVSTSVPYSAHLAARRAARRAGVPWIAEYRDPWSVAPPQFGRRPALRQLVDERLDRAVVRAADAVVVTTEGTAERFRRGFEGLDPARLRVVRNGFDPGPEGTPPPPGEPLRLVYSGTLLSADYAAPLLEGIGRAVAGGHGSVRLDVYGPEGPWREALGALGPDAAGAVRLHGLVSPGEVAGRLASASAAVLLQPDPAHGLNIAGKLYEYLGVRRPVLAALPERSEAAALIERYGEGRFVRPLTAEAVDAAIRALFAEHREGALQAPARGPEPVDALSRATQAGALASLLDEVARGPAGGLAER